MKFKKKTFQNTYMDVFRKVKFEGLFKNKICIGLNYDENEALHIICDFSQLR